MVILCEDFFCGRQAREFEDLRINVGFDGDQFKLDPCISFCYKSTCVGAKPGTANSTYTDKMCRFRNVKDTIANPPDKPTESERTESLNYCPLDASRDTI